MTDWEIRRHIVMVGKKMYEQKLVVSTDGNISFRMKSDKIIITPSGFCLGDLDFNHMVHVDSNGNHKAGQLTPSTELPVHLEVYRQRSDINAVIHAHPPIITAFTLAGIDFSEPFLPEFVIMYDKIPIAPYAAPATVESAISIRELIKNHDIIVLDRHGAVTVGKTLREAYCRMEKLEQIAQILFIARQLGEIKPLSDKEYKKLLLLRKKLENNL